ncbi:MAG: hypothetical protein QXD05_00165 [Candidatus Pacearchaeota archaeon]
MIKRLHKFPQINGLDKELDFIIHEVENLTGKLVNELPPKNLVKEYSRFFKKEKEGIYKEYIKINGEYRVWESIPSEIENSSSGGSNTYIYIAYADDANGNGFTLTFDENKDYIAIKHTREEIINPTQSDFVGLWKKIKGEQGNDGTGAFVYIAYASDNEGNNFTLNFNPDLDYIAILSATTPIENPQASDFAGLWKKYRGPGLITGGNVGQIIVKKSTSDYDVEWKDNELKSLKDVSIDNPQDGQVLSYDAGLNKWKPITISVSGAAILLYSWQVGGIYSQLLNFLSTKIVVL